MAPRLSRPGRPPFDFSGKHTFITGGASGLGLCMAKLVLQRGASVTINDIADGKAALAELESVIKEQKLPGKVWFVQGDVGVFEQVNAAIASAEEQMGPIDCLVANAGIPMPGMFLAEPLESFERVNRVNYLGVVYTLKAGLPRMIARRSGCVLVVSSLMGLLAAFGASPYGASKAAVLSIAKSLQLELIGTGVDVTVALPTFADTAMTRSADEKNSQLPSAAIEIKNSLKSYPAEVVAELMIQGVERGLFYAPQPDKKTSLLVATLCGSPRTYDNFTEFLLQPVYYFGNLYLRWTVGSKIITWLKAAAAEQAAKPQPVASEKAEAGVKAEAGPEAEPKATKQGAGAA